MKRRVLMVIAWLMGAGGLFLVTGCEKPLLSPDEDRSPFDRYDSMRNQHAEQYTMDEFGHRRPNLRERLMPKQ